MWLSKKFKSVHGFAAEKGTVSLGGSATVRSSSTVQSVSVNCYAPYGYSAYAPGGEEILIINGPDGGAGAGTRMKDETLGEGEISIISDGGGRVKLGKDGSVEINGFVFTKDGTIKNSRGETVI